MYFNMKLNFLLWSIVIFDVIVTILYKLKGHKTGESICLCFYELLKSRSVKISRKYSQTACRLPVEKGVIVLCFDGTVTSSLQTQADGKCWGQLWRGGELQGKNRPLSLPVPYILTTNVLLPTRNNTHTSAHEPEKCILSLRIQWRQIPSFPRFSQEFL